MLGKDGARIYRSPALVQKSLADTRALSYRWRDYPAKYHSKPVLTRTKLADNSCDTSIRQLMLCPIDVAVTRRNVVLNPSYLGIIPYYVAASRTGPVITRTMSPRHGRQDAQNTQKPTTIGEMCTRIVRQFTDELREKLRPLWTQSYGEISKPFN